MSGLELIPHVLAKASDTVAIMTSSPQTIESAVEAMRVGAFDYVLKPFDLGKLESAVRRSVEHSYLRVAKRLYGSHLEEMVRQRMADTAVDSG